MSPSPHPIHQRILHLIQSQIGAQQDAGLKVEVFPDTDVTLGEHLIYRPDLSIYTAARLPTIPDRLTLAPDLIVEILSPNNRPMDLINKREDYERSAVREYIIVDPHTGRTTQLALRGTIYHELPPAGDMIRSDAIPGLSLDVRAIRAMARPW